MVGRAPPELTDVRTTAVRLALLLLGHACVLVGVVGIFVPLLPTTPFLLLAAWLYSKSSQRLHEWLVRHPRLGRPILDWQRHGVVRTRVKVISVLLIAGSLAIPLTSDDLAAPVKLLAAATGAGVTVFLLTRPSAPR